MNPLYVLLGTIIGVTSLLSINKNRNTKLSSKMIENIKSGNITTGDAEVDVKTGWDAISWLSPSYIEGKTGAALIKMADTTPKIKLIYDNANSGWGITNIFDYATTSDNDVLAMLESLSYKTQLSWLAYNYYKTYNKSMKDDLYNSFDTEDKQKALEIFNNLK